MGLRERVALILVTVIITQISIFQCLPIEPQKIPVNRYLDNFMKAKGMKSVLPVKGAQTPKSLYSNGNTAETKDAPIKKSMFKAYNFPKMEYMTTASKDPFYSEADTYEPVLKNIGYPQTKAVNDFKKQLRLKRKLNRVNDNKIYLTKIKPQQFSNMPHIYGEDTFPEVLFPKDAMETLAPHYWPTTHKEKEQQNNLPELPMFNSKATEFCKQKPFRRRFKSKTQHFMEEVDKMKKKMNRPTIKNMTEESTTIVNTCDKSGNLMNPVSNSTKLPTSQETKPVTTQIEPDFVPETPEPLTDNNTTKNENANNLGEIKDLGGNPEINCQELEEVPSVNNATDKNQENSTETITNNDTEKDKDQNSEKKDIADGNEPENKVCNNKAPFKSIIVVPVGDSIREIQIPVSDTTTDSPIILIIPTTSRTDTLAKLVNISCVTKMVSNTPVSNISTTNEASQAGTFLPDVMTDLPLTIKEYILENSNISGTDFLVLDFEKLPNNSMCHNIKESTSQTTLDGMSPMENPAISLPDILPSKVQGIDQASSINNSTDMSSSNENDSKNNNSLLDTNESNNNLPITQTDSSNIFSPSVISDGNTDNEKGPTPSDEEDPTQSNTENSPESITFDTNPDNITEDILQPEEDIDIRSAPITDEQGLPLNNDSKNGEKSNKLDSGSEADRDIKIAPVSDIQENSLLLNDTENEENTTSTSEDALTDEPLSDQEDDHSIKDLPIPPMSSKLEDNSDNGGADSPPPNNVVDSDKLTNIPIENVPPDNEKSYDEAYPMICEANTKSEIPASQISDTTSSIDETGTPITDKIDIIEPQTKELPVNGPTGDNNEVSSPNIDDPKDIVDISMLDPISDASPIELTDEIEKDTGVVDGDTDLSDSIPPDQPLVDEIYTILPVENFSTDSLTDYTKLQNPDSQPPLLCATESGDPSALDEAKPATLPSGIENNDTLPFEEVITDTKVIEDPISPEVPQVTDGVDGLSDDVPTSVAESPPTPTDIDLSSAEITNLIKYMYANV